MHNPILLALTAIGLWSTLAFISTQLTSIPPFFLVGVALVIGSLPGIRHFRTWRQSVTTIAVGIAGLFGYHFLLFMAFRFAPPVEANVINYLWPVLIVLFSPLLLKGHHLKIHHYLGSLTAFLGTVLIVTGGKLNPDLSHGLGYLLAFMAALTWSLYSIVTKRLPAFPTSAVGGFCLIGGILSLIAHFFLEAPATPNGKDWLIMLILGLGPMGVAFYAWDGAIKKGDPRIIGALSYLTPLLSTIILVWIGGKEFTSIAAWAMALVITGALIGSMDVFRPKK